MFTKFFKKFVVVGVVSVSLSMGIVSCAAMMGGGVGLDSSVDPKDPKANYTRGMVEHENGRYGVAIRYFNQAIRLNPNYVDAYVGRGLSRGMCCDGQYFNEAMADFNKALALDSKNAATYVARANVYNGRGHHDRALADYNQAIILDANNADHYAGRGATHVLKKDFDRAVADYNRAIEIDSVNVYAYFGRGVAHAVLKDDLEQSLADLAIALRLDPNGEKIDVSHMINLVKGKLQPGGSGQAGCPQINESDLIGVWEYESSDNILSHTQSRPTHHYEFRNDKTGTGQYGMPIKWQLKNGYMLETHYFYQGNLMSSSVTDIELSENGTLLTFHLDGKDYRELSRLVALPPCDYMRGPRAKREMYRKAASKSPKPEPIVVPEPVATPNPIPAQEETATAVPATPVTAANTQNIDKRLVGGTWHPDCGGYYPMTFNEDGTLVFSEDGSKAKWRTEGNKIIITYSNGRTHTAEYSIDENGNMSYADCLSWRGGGRLQKRGELAVRQPSGFQAGGSLTGGRTRPSITRVVTQNLPALHHAYNRRLAVKPGLEGMITVKFAIDESGKVMWAQLVNSTINDSDLETTVVNRVKSWNFGKIDKPGDVTEVVYPFPFSE